MALVNMKHSKSEASEYTSPEMVGMEPEYPYGLCISLHNDELEKLNITALPQVGSEMTLTAKAYVKEVSSYSQQDGKERKEVRLQITDMEISGANGKADNSERATMLYGGEK